MAEIFPFIVLKSKIERLFAHYKYIKCFEYKSNNNQIGEVAVCLCNFEIAMKRIEDFKYTDAHMTETDFEIKI